MFFRIIKFISLLLFITGLFVVVIFFIDPSSLIYIYRGADEKTIWAESKHLPIKKIISDTSFFKAPNTEWSPDSKHFSFFDFVRLEWATKEWALKIVDTRFFTIKTIFVGDYKTSEYFWINNDTVRVYVSAGSGAVAYRDININIDKPIIKVDDWSSGDWTPEKTFHSPNF